MIVHKYRRDADTTASIFTSKKVWLSTPAALNDPFESELHTIPTESRTANVAVMKQAQLTGFLLNARRNKQTGNFYGLSRNEICKLLEQFEKFQNFDEAYANFSDFITQRIGNPPSDPEKVFSQLPCQMAAVGIFSLSEIPDNPLMWAHYADDHKGLCLGFEVVDGSALADEKRCLKVEYSDFPPQFGEGFTHELSISLDDQGRLKSASRIAFSDPVVQAAISTKGCEWEYEREWRYVEPTAGEFDWPGPIVEITFGLRCPQDRRDYYLKLAQEFIPNDVRFYEMRKLPNTKSLERKSLSLPSLRLGARPAVSSIIEVERLLESRKYLDALPMVEQLLKSTPDSAELWRCKGLVLGWTEDHLGALECFERAVALKADFLYASAPPTCSDEPVYAAGLMGRSSSMRRMVQTGSFSSVSLSQADGSIPLSFAVANRL